MNRRKFGYKYIQPFKDEIYEIFNIGWEDQSKKKGPSPMLSELVLRYPNSLDPPSN